MEENERALSATPTVSAQTPDLTHVPNEKIKNGDEIAGGDFIRSCTLTTVRLELVSIDVFRRIFHRWGQWGRQFNLFGKRSISLCRNSLLLAGRMN